MPASYAFHPKWKVETNLRRILYSFKWCTVYTMNSCRWYIFITNWYPFRGSLFILSLLNAILSCTEYINNMIHSIRIEDWLRYFHLDYILLILNRVLDDHIKQLKVCSDLYFSIIGKSYLFFDTIRWFMITKNDLEINWTCNRLIAVIVHFL